jgi:probable addiction module antidote protein
MTRKKKDVTSVSHDEYMIRRLRESPNFVAEYLNAALDDTEEPAVLRIALRRIAEARGGIAKVAKAAGIERESLYRALSARGNPRLSTLVAVTKAVGLKLTVEAARWACPASAHCHCHSKLGDRVCVRTQSSLRDLLPFSHLSQR